MPWGFEFSACQETESPKTGFKEREDASKLPSAAYLSTMTILGLVAGVLMYTSFAGEMI